jgi:hypothetical protein
MLKPMTPYEAHFYITTQQHNREITLTLRELDRVIDRYKQSNPELSNLLQIERDKYSLNYKDPFYKGD